MNDLLLLISVPYLILGIYFIFFSSFKEDFFEIARQEPLGALIFPATWPVIVLFLYINHEEIIKFTIAQNRISYINSCPMWVKGSYLYYLNHKKEILKQIKTEIQEEPPSIEEYDFPQKWNKKNWLWMYNHYLKNSLYEHK